MVAGQVFTSGNGVGVGVGVVVHFPVEDLGHQILVMKLQVRDLSRPPLLRALFRALLGELQLPLMARNVGQKHGFSLFPLLL